jgi:hypothetical protein
MAEPDLDDVSRRLGASRAELSRILHRRGVSAAYYYQDARNGGVLVDDDEFPRSRLMRLILEKRLLPVGLGAVLIIVFALNPVLARRVLRHVPLKLVATRLLTR